MAKRQTEEEMLAEVMKAQDGTGDVDNDNNPDTGTPDPDEVEGVVLEPVNHNIMPSEAVETGLKSEKDMLVQKPTDDIDVKPVSTDKPKDDPDANASNTTSDDPLTVVNAKKRIHDAQTKMHVATSERAEMEALLDTANRRIQSYESIIAKKGSDSTEGIQAQKNIESTNTKALAEIEALKAEYPEVAGPLIVAFDTITKMQGKIDELSKQQVTSSESNKESMQALLDNMHFKRIAEYHPDYAVVSKSQEFKEWKDGLSPFERSAAVRIAADGDADESISMLDKFKEDTGYGGNGNRNDSVDNNIDNDTTTANLELAKSKTSPTFTKKKSLNLRSNNKTLSMAQLRSLPPTKESEQLILEAMNSGRIVG